jgi:hypothetical protein
VKEEGKNRSVCGLKFECRMEKKEERKQKRLSLSLSLHRRGK